MTDIGSRTTPHPPEPDPREHVQRLRPNAVGLVAVVFMAVATAAPISAMVGNVPVAVGFGNGTGAPAGYLVATIVLTVFAVGYMAMARHITAAGAFYGFVSHGLGQVAGMCAGLLATVAYIVFEASLTGLFAYFAKLTMADLFGVSLPWLCYALLMLALNAVLSHFDINLTSKVLGLALVSEVLILTALAVAILVDGGGPDGFVPQVVNPLNAFDAASGVAGASVGLGLFMAFWSWVGFESTAMYGEESRDPKRIVPIATMLVVVGVGVFYVFVSWMVVAANGLDRSVRVAGGDSPAELLFGPTRVLLGGWAVTLFQILLVTGSFACGMAFHNCASRYLYAIGREDVVPGTRRTLGATHPKHGSPHVASNVQCGIATALVLGFALAGKDPYLDLFVVLSVLGTMAILIVQILSSAAVIGYFHVRRKHPETAHPLRTFAAPLVGGLAMVYVVILLFQNLDTAGGAASQTTIFRMIPYLVLGVAVFGVVLALYTKVRAPHRFALIGRVVLEESTERAA
ncbi:APC family permease [Embleya hyalina]|uniref:Amino acid permease n=1 Tax=Embleya hyalina TaxID=516124 RepID=A0A401YEC6_9ACTN|nr:APC family permease [Embleya hyalina]GCD92956.1 amino acid permease [Embleya hyalina]